MEFPNFSIFTYPNHKKVYRAREFLFGGLDIYIYLCVHNLHYTEFYIIINVITIIIVIIKSVE